MCQIFVIQVSFESSERLEVDSRVYVINILFNLNSQGNEKFDVLSQGTYDIQNLGNETLFIADHESVKKDMHLIGWLQNYGSKGALRLECLRF